MMIRKYFETVGEGHDSYCSKTLLELLFSGTPFIPHFKEDPPPPPTIGLL